LRGVDPIADDRVDIELVLAHLLLVRAAVLRRRMA